MNCYYRNSGSCGSTKNARIIFLQIIEKFEPK